MLTNIFSSLLPRFMFLFAPDEPGSGGGGDDSPASEDAPETEPSDDSTAEDEPEIEEEEKDKDDITLSPEALSKRLGRKGKQAKKELMETFGVKTEKELKTKLDAGQKAIDAALSDDERSEKQKTESTEAKVLAETERDDALKDAQVANLRAESLGLMAGRFHDPATAFLLLDYSEVDMTSGDFDGLADAIKSLEETAPWALMPEGDQRTRQKKKVPKDVTPNPQSEGDATKETEDQKRQRYFGKGTTPEFFTPDAKGGVQFQSEAQEQG